MNEITKVAKQELAQEAKRSKIERAKDVLSQITELEAVLASLYRQLEDIESEG